MKIIHLFRRIQGADAVAMETRLAVTSESPLAEAMKDAIVRANEARSIDSFTLCLLLLIEQSFAFL